MVVACVVLWQHFQKGHGWVYAFSTNTLVGLAYDSQLLYTSCRILTLGFSNLNTNKALVREK